MPENLTSAAFAEHLNTKFRLSHEALDSIEVELIEVTDGKPNPRRELFSLLFRGPLETFLPQYLYRVEHDKMGTFDLFLVPVGKDENGFNYEAIFNRLIR